MGTSCETCAVLSPPYSCGLSVPFTLYIPTVPPTLPLTLFIWPTLPICAAAAELSVLAGMRTQRRVVVATMAGGAAASTPVYRYLWGSFIVRVGEWRGEGGRGGEAGEGRGGEGRQGRGSLGTGLLIRLSNLQNRRR